MWFQCKTIDLIVIIIIIIILVHKRMAIMEHVKIKPAELFYN